MRNHSAQDDAVFNGPGQATWFRVRVADPSTTLQDLTTLFGWDFVETVDITESLDENAAKLTLGLRREIFLNSMSPDMAGSRVNKLGGGTRLLDYNREIIVDAQIQPAGKPADPAAWSTIFDGRITNIDAGQDPMQVEAMDMADRLVSKQIKTVRAYGVWITARTMRTGAVVCASTDNPNSPAHGFWSFTPASGSTGVTGAAEPAWPANPTIGVSTVLDNGNTWTCVAKPTGAPASSGTPMETQLQMLLDDNAAGVTLYTPVSPGFVMRDYDQSVQALMTALLAVAACNAWDLRWRWDDGTAQFRLTLYNPNRTAASVYTIPSSKYRPLDQYQRDFQYVRNDIDVPFYDRNNLDAQGLPQPATANSQDAVSIAAYEDLWMSVAEGAGSPINTLTQAQAMADAIKSDLSQPLVELPVVLDFTWWLQLNDVITLGADGVHSDSDLTMAISTIEHSLKQGDAGTTTFGLRQKPSSGHKKWHDMAGLPGFNGGAARMVGPRAPALLATGSAIAGGTITFQVPSQRDQYDQTELYLSTATGFAPSSANLVATGRTGRFDVVGLTANTTYYVRIAHRDRRGNLSAFSAEQSFVARQVQTADIANLAITDAKVNDVAGSKITGTIATSTLPTAQRQVVYVEWASDAAYTPDSLLNFTEIVDPVAIYSAGTSAPSATELFTCHVEATLQGSAVIPGSKWQVYCKDNLGNVVAASPWWYVNVNAAGTFEVTAILHRSVQLSSGKSYSFYIRGYTPDGTQIVAAQTLKAKDAVAPFDPGSFIYLEASNA